MQKLRNYFQSLLFAFSEPEFYRQRLAMPIGTTIRWSILTLILGGLVMTGIWGILRAPTMIAQSREAVKTISSALPENASFRFEEGKMTVSDLKLPWSVETPGQFPKDEFPSRLMSITDASGSSDSLITLTPETLLLQTVNGAPLTLRYADIFDGQSFSVTAMQARDEANRAITQIANNLPLVLLGIAVMTISANAIAGFFTITLFSFLVQTIGWFWSIRLRYSKAFQLGLLIYPVALILHDTVALIVHPLTLPITTMAYIGIVLLVFWNIRQSRMSTIQE